MLQSATSASYHGNPVLQHYSWEGCGFLPLGTQGDRTLSVNEAPERPVHWKPTGRAVSGHSAAAPSVGDSRERNMQVSVSSYRGETARGNHVKDKHASSQQAATVHRSMLKQVGGGGKASPAGCGLGESPGRVGQVVKGGKEHWAVVRRRLEEAGEVAMTLVFRDGSTQLRSEQVRGRVDWGELDRDRGVSS